MISKFLQIRGWRPRILKVFLDHKNNFGNKIPFMTIMKNQATDMSRQLLYGFPICKGQLISKGLYKIFICTKKWTKIFLCFCISVIAYKKRSNQSLCICIKKNQSFQKESECLNIFCSILIWKSLLLHNAKKENIFESFIQILHFVFCTKNGLKNNQNQNSNFIFFPLLFF